MHSRRALSVFLLVAMVGGAACASSKKATSGGASRTIEVRALDSLRFEPSRIEVRSGESVRFRVTNAGKIRHEFVLGDDSVQREHEAGMSGSAHATGGHSPGMTMNAGLAVLSVNAGETREVSVTFDRAGTVLYGCHVTGHYGAGMVGQVVVA